MKENGRAILRPDIRPLAIHLRRVVILEEDLQQVFVGNLGRIVRDLDCLGMTGRVRADIMVGRVRSMSAGIADPGLQNAGSGAEGLFYAPKTSGCKCRFLHDNSLPYENDSAIRLDGEKTGCGINRA